MALTAESACAERQCEEAIGLIEESVRRRPGDLRLFYWLGLCYGGGCRTHALVHPEMAIPYLRQALRLAPANDSSRAAVLEQLGSTVIRDTAIPREEALRAAIEWHSEAAEIYQALAMYEDWARAQFNLGNSFCDLSDLTGENRWPEAIRRYELALQVRTRDKDPERYAALQENLGTAYRRLTPPETGRGARNSILCCRRALSIYTCSNFPEKHAALQNNLGNAYLSLAGTDDSAALRHARRALRHFERALRIQSRDPQSRAFGITQYNRAQAYARLSNTGMTAACLKAAAAAFEACADDRYIHAVAALASRIVSGTGLPACPGPPPAGQRPC